MPLATTTPPQAASVGGTSKADGVKQALRVLGGGAVAAKDAFWGSLDVLSAAAEAATKAPEKAKGLVEDGKAAIEGTEPMKVTRKGGAPEAPGGDEK